MTIDESTPVAPPTGRRVYTAEPLSMFLHGAVVILVVTCATVLRVTHNLDTTTLGTVFGAALGYASGLTQVGRRY